MLLYAWNSNSDVWKYISIKQRAGWRPSDSTLSHPNSSLRQEFPPISEAITTLYQLYMKGRKEGRKRKVRRRWAEGRKEREEGGRKGGWKTPCRLIAEGMSADCSTPGLPVHHQLPEFTLTHVPSPALNFPSIRVFSNESGLCIRWTKHWSFSFSISPFNEYLGLIFFRMDWLDLLAVQGTLKSLLKHYSSKASILPHSAFFIIQPSHPCMTTGKAIALTRWTFVGKVMSLLFIMLYRLVITFLPRSKCLLISWLQSHLQWFWSPQKIVCHCFNRFPIYLPRIDGTGYHNVSFLNVEFQANFFTLLFHFQEAL